jgi:hypothetical protein
LKAKDGKLVKVRLLMSLILICPLTVAGQSGNGQPDDGLVRRALANEVREAANAQHPMRYRLRKSSPHLVSTKEMFETRDGAVARLVAINDAPLSAEDEQKEQARLNLLLAEPSRQNHRKQSEDEDAARAVKVLRALPNAFLYQYAGTVEGSGEKVAKFTFKPNPRYDPPDLETHVLTEMTGELWIDVAQERVTRLEGRLQQDVNFGLGILGQLSKGGWILLQQADVGDHQWRIIHFKMSMTGRVFFKTKVFDTTEDENHFVPVPVGITYQDAIRKLRDRQSDAGQTAVSAAPATK